MSVKRKLVPIYKKRKGAAAVIVALAIVVILGVAAIAVDAGNMYVAQNELQNAADAGAMAGANVLYNADHQTIYSGTISDATAAALANLSQKAPVEVTDVEIGHWSFKTQDFDPFTSAEVTAYTGVNLTHYTTAELDDRSDPNHPATGFINAVRVVTKRKTTPVTKFFSWILTSADLQASADAVAYIGFTGSVGAGEFDQPIAICAGAISWGGDVTCNVGRMLNSSGESDTSGTGGWTNMTTEEQEGTCNNTDDNELQAFIDGPKGACGVGNPLEIDLGDHLSATNGVADNIFRGIEDCWKAGLYDSDGDGVKDSPIDTDGDGWPDRPWNLTLPVIDCNTGAVTGNCIKILGAVSVNVLWVHRDNDVKYEDIPRSMTVPGFPGGESWAMTTNYDECDEDCRLLEWGNFASHFGLQNVTGSAASLLSKTIYFLPDCDDMNLGAGISGGGNFGVPARISVLVN